MKAILAIVLLLVSPVGLYLMGNKQAAGFVGLYVLFSLPSIFEVGYHSVKTKTLPKIVGGPSIQFGRRRWQCKTK